MKTRFQKSVENVQESVNRSIDGEVIWCSLVTSRLYDNVEDALCEINFFRKYKDIACTMSDDECLDIYKGVIILFGRQISKPLFIKNLFEDIFDWHRLDFANKRIAYILKNSHGEYGKRIIDFLYEKDYYMMLHDYNVLRTQGLL